LSEGTKQNPSNPNKILNIISVGTEFKNIIVTYIKNY